MVEDIIDQVTRKLVDLLPDAIVNMENPEQDGHHFEAVVISRIFEGMPLIEQHRMVMNALKQELASSIHALHLKTFTPVSWQEYKAESEQTHRGKESL